MPSTNKLSSRITRSVAKFLLSFCGLASFGVVTKLVALGTAFLVLFAIPASITLLNANNTYATGSSNGNSNTITANLPGSVAIRLLDSTGITEISSLDFNNLTPTPQGTTASKSFIVDVATSNPTGYKLYMQSDYKIDDGDNDSSNDIYTTNLTHTDSDVTDVIPTNTTSGSKVYWNYINPLINSGSSNPTPSVIPPYGTPDKIAQYFSPTNSHQSTIDINVGIDTTIVSGTYENQLLFSAVGNPTTLNYTVSFNTNGGTMSGEDIEETAGAWVHSVTVPGSPSDTDYTDYIPSKADSLFTGWTISVPTGSTATASCNGTNVCHPGDSLNITAGTTAAGDIVGDVVLTAQYTSISTMQAMTPTICNTAAIGASTTLTDTRDSSTYTIRKLKDGNCWMTQNLNYLPTNGTTLSLASSNVALSTTLQTSDSSKDNYLTDNCSTGNVDKYCTYYDSSYPEYGTYYNWYASTAGTGTSDLVSANATSSICPKGWRLPTGGPGGEFGILYSFYDSYDNMTTNTAGPEFMLSGLRNYASMYDQSVGGYYWSSTAYSDAPYTYSLYLDSSGVINLAGLNNRKQNGFTLRCLAHDNSYSILGVDPNGGTWSGSSNSQTFTQAPESTQNISNPTNNATYNISYDMGSTGLPTPTSPTSAERAFTGWTASLGEGATFVPASGLYTYGTGNSSLVAQYNTTSNSFNLPTLSKTDYTCKWHQGSASGAEKQSNVTITGDTTFYAVCEPNERTIANSTYFQEVTSCPSTLVEGTQYSLIDQGEPSKSYNTARLADGKCWMTSDYNLSSAAGTLSSTYYNVPSTSTFQLRASSTTWGTSSTGNYVYNRTGTNGGLYSWYAATAGTNPSSGTSSYDICPKGWRLPTQAEYQAIIDNYGSTGAALVASNAKLQYSGFCLSGYCPINVGSRGYYWSSTASSSSQAYYLYFRSSSAGMNNDSKYSGLSVRCVFDGGLNSISAMQEMTPTICENTEKGTQKTLTDTRDNNTYTVRKLADDKCWMTDNLRLTGRNDPFTPENTQTDTSFTMTTAASNTGTWCTTSSADCDDKFQYIDTGSTYGVLYNWYTATAGSGKYSTSSGTAAYSICPRGWRLPTSGGTSGEFAKLDIAWGGTGANRDNANTYGNFTGTTADASHAGFILAGYRNGSSTNGQGTVGNYWSSTANSSNFAYHLNLSSSVSNVYPSGGYYKYYGFSVRCVAQ